MYNETVYKNERLKRMAKRGRPRIHEDRIAYQNQWAKENQDKIVVKLSKDEIIRIRAFASMFGPNISRFIQYVCEDYYMNIYNNSSDEEKARMDKSIAAFKEQYINSKKTSSDTK